MAARGRLRSRRGVAGRTLVGLLLAGLVAPAAAQQRPEAEAPEETLAREILLTMHRGNELEMRLGRLAAERAQSRKLRDFGDRLLRDHRLGDRMVLNLARQRNFAFALAGEADEEVAEEVAARRGDEAEELEPTAAGLEPDVTDPEEIERRLRDAPDPAFDREFLETSVALHHRRIRRLERARLRLPDDSEVQGLLNNLIPILRQHLELAEALLTGLER